MNLKTINNGRVFFLAGLLMFLLGACKKSFLDVIPTDVIPTDAFYKSANDVEGGVNGAYALQRTMYSSFFYYNIAETRSDNTSNKLGAQAEHRAVDNFTADQGNYIFANDWNQSYTCINQCNAVIDRAPSVNMDEGLKNRLIGEAKFIRAATYFSLVMDYAGVPLRVHETTSLSGDNSMPRASVQDVYNLIASDLEFAGQSLPAQYTGNDIGRATSGAAWGLLGKAELQQGKKDSAVYYLRKVVNSNQYSLLPNYADLWDPSKKNTSESLFEIQYLPPNTGSPFWNGLATPALHLPGGTNTAFPNTPTQDLIDAYEPGDKRFKASIAYDPTNRPYIIKFRDTADNLGFNARNDFPVLRYADILLALAEALGESNEAYNLINQVRKRAGLGDISAATPGTFMNKVMHERQVELAFECQRWHDLLRLPPAQTVSIMNADLKRDLGASMPRAIDEHDLLCPIPIVETQTNAAVTQNPGY